MRIVGGGSRRLLAGDSSSIEMEIMEAVNDPSLENYDAAASKAKL